MGSSGKFILMNDIDLSGVEWIGKILRGEFNGNGYTISNLTINSTESKQAFFSQNHGTIKNLNITNASVTGAGSIAILVSEGWGGSIENCSVSGSVVASNYSGLLMGNSNGTSVKNCSAYGTLDVTGNESGGLIGRMCKKVENCYAKVDVTGKTYGSTGGLVGVLNLTDNKIVNSISEGNVNGGSGLVGSLNGGTVENCKTTGTVTNGSGLVAYARGKVLNSIATGNITNGCGLVGELAANYTIENCMASGVVTNGSGFVRLNAGTIKNSIATGDVTTGSGFVGDNRGTIENASAAGKVTSGNGFVGTNRAIITNAVATGEIKSGSGFVGDNNGINALITNASVTGNVTGGSGFAGSNSGTIEKSSASGNVSGGNYIAGFVGNNSGRINESYATGNVVATGERVGGFVGDNRGLTGIIENCYSKGDVKAESWRVGGFVGLNEAGASIKNSYSTGDIDNSVRGDRVNTFVGEVSSASVENSYATGTVLDKGGIFGSANTNCYALTADLSKAGTKQGNVTLQMAEWFEDGQNLMFLGDAYDYYYNPPELWGNYEEHPEEFTQFQVGANSGLKNQLDMNLQFRMYNFYGDVSSVESASDTLERVDAFKERLSEHRSMIGSVRNRLDSVLESQSIRLENLNSSHSTIVDTDFASETAALTRNQILQQATTSLLSQANFMPNIALQLLQ